MAVQPVGQGLHVHFNRTELPALQSFYPGTRFDGFVGQNMEGIVCLAMLSATIVAAFSQLRYMDSHPDVVPYISLAMLTILPAWPRMYDGEGNYSVKALPSRRSSSRCAWHARCGGRGSALGRGRRLSRDAS